MSKKKIFVMNVIQPGSKKRKKKKKNKMIIKRVIYELYGVKIVILKLVNF
jgi:hypothetical protein